MEEKELYNAKFEEVTKEIGRINERLDKVENRYNSLDRSMVKMELMVGNLEAKFDKMETKLDTFITSLNKEKETISESPTKEKARLWDFVVQYIIMGAIGLAMGYIGMKLGAK